MFFYPRENECVWGEDLKPNGHETWNKEEFSIYWERNKFLFFDLPPELIEQWVFRYFDSHPHCYIPLSDIKCTKVKIEPREFMDNVRSATDNILNPDWDYEVFHNNPKGHPTSNALDQGSWDYPPVLLSVPDGFTDGYDSWPEAKYLLIEGHQRRRYLNALLHRNKALQKQEVYIIESPVVASLRTIKIHK